MRTSDDRLLSDQYDEVNEGFLDRLDPNRKAENIKTKYTEEINRLIKSLYKDMLKTGFDVNKISPYIIEDNIVSPLNSLERLKTMLQFFESPEEKEQEEIDKSAEADKRQLAEKIKELRAKGTPVEYIGRNPHYKQGPNIWYSLINGHKANPSWAKNLEKSFRERNMSNSLYDSPITDTVTIFDNRNNAVEAKKIGQYWTINGQRVTGLATQKKIKDALIHQYQQDQKKKGPNNERI